MVNAIDALRTGRDPYPDGLSPSIPFLELFEVAGRSRSELFAVSRSDPFSLQLQLAMGLYGRPESEHHAPDGWALDGENQLIHHVVGLPTSLEPYGVIDRVTREILVDAWMANIVRHVQLGAEGHRAWYEPPTAIDITANFERAGETYVGNIEIVEHDGSRTSVRSTATLRGGVWIIDTLPVQAGQPPVVSFVLAKPETTDLTVVTGAAGGSPDPLSPETTAITVVSSESQEIPQMPRETLVVTPGMRVAFALGSDNRTWPAWQGRTIGQAGWIGVAVPPQGLALLVTGPDGSSEIWEVRWDGTTVRVDA